MGKYIAERLKADKTLGAKYYNYDKYRYVYDAILEDGITEGTKDYQAVTEIFADFMANEVLKNEDSMRRLTERDANIIVKLYRWVKNAISRLGNSEEDRKVKKEMRKLEELLAKALDESHGGISLDTVEEQMKSAEAKRRAEASREKANVPQNGKLATARASVDVDKQGEVSYNKSQGRYSIYTPRDIKDVTQEDYEHHYWAFANDVISQSEWGVVNNAISDIKLRKKYPQTIDGIYMIPTGEYRGSATVYNKIVFTDGLHEAPSIEMVVEIVSTDKEFLKEAREVTYGFGYKGIQIKNSEVFKVYTPETYGYVEFVQNGQGSIQNNTSNSGDKNGRGVIGETSKTSRGIDSEGSTLTKEQVEYFKDSKVRDEDGNLLVVYHGTPNGKFYEFSYDKAGTEGGAQHGYGFYFSERESDAKLYTQGKGSIIKGYLNITNPINATAKDLSSDVGKIFDRLPLYAKNNLIEKYGDLEKAKQQCAKWDNGTMISILCRATKMHPSVFNNILLNLGYDGVVYAEDGYATEYVAFKENQIKLTTNKTPTKKADIRYSLNVTEQSIKDAETDRAERKTSSARFSLKYANEIAERQFKDDEKFGFHVTDEKLNEAIESTARMVDMMSKHLDILPEDKIGKKNETIKSNSSYDKSIENTTICVRTLAYNQFGYKKGRRGTPALTLF